VGGYFHAISNALSQRMQENCEDLGLTASQSMFLHYLWYREHILKEPTHAKELEAFFDIKHPTVSGILQRMEAAGFVTFQASESDRRCKTIHMTPLAEDIHAEAERHIRQTEAILTQGMSEEEITQLRSLLGKAANNLGVFCKHPAVSLPKEEPKL
jgi:DNA-binding MarR family transcriptional regulator